MFRAADVGKAAAAILHVLSCQPFGTLNTMAIILAHLSYLPDTEVQGISFDDLKRVIDEGGEVEFRCESPSVGQNVSHFEAALKEEECPNHPFKSVAWI